MSHRKSGGVRTNFSLVPRGRGPLLTSVFPILYHKVVFAGLRVLNRACVANPPTLPCPLAGSRGRAGPGEGGPGAWCQENPHLRASPPRRVQGVGRGGSGENLRGFPAGAAGGGAGEGGGLVCRVRAGSSASDRVTHVQTLGPGLGGSPECLWNWGTGRDACAPHTAHEAAAPPLSRTRTPRPGGRAAAPRQEAVGPGGDRAAFPRGN